MAYRSLPRPPTPCVRTEFVRPSATSLTARLEIDINRLPVLALALASFAPPAGAAGAGFQKPYFGAKRRTPPVRKPHP